MIIKDFKAPALDKVFDEIYKRIDDPTTFIKFRNFVFGNGLRYKSVDDRTYFLRLMNNNRLNMFGKIVKEIDVNCGDSHIEETILNNTFSIDTLKFNFKYAILNEMSILNEKFIDAIYECEKTFNKKEQCIDTHKQKFGKNVNKIMKSSGASDLTIYSYWKFIHEKRLLPPLIFLGFIKLIEKRAISTVQLKKALRVTKVEEFANYNLELLPSPISLSLGIIKASIYLREYERK